MTNNRSNLVKDTIEKFSTSPNNTRKIGKVIGAESCPGDLVLLYGELGSGKTCLTQGILWGMGSDEYARSPTFVMISEYKTSIPLYHMDFYRLDVDQNTTEIGIEEYIDDYGVCVIEWPEKVPYLANRDHLEVKIKVSSETDRMISLSGIGKRYNKIIQTLKEILKEK